MEAVASVSPGAVAEAVPRAISLTDWSKAIAVARRAPFAAIATVDDDGFPRTTPIGSVCLHPSEPRGYYLERFTAHMPKNLERDERCCLLFVDAALPFWLASLVRGRFARPPAVRLRARAGARRKATPEEIARFQKRVHFAKPTRGYDLLWKGMSNARDLYIDAIEPVRIGKMTAGCW